jgi:hypothetical protein
MARPRDDRDDEQQNLAVNPIRPPAEGGEEVDEDLARLARRRAEQRREPGDPGGPDTAR